jgi:ribosomal protein S18 acetylase RimI-like enzyme
LTGSELRGGRAADLDAVLALWGRAEVSPSFTDNAGALRLLLEVDSDALLLAEAGGMIVGAVIAAWNGWRGSFYRLAVEPQHRRHGLGTELVRAGERRLRRLGAFRIDALVATEDAAAIAFWEACGYRHQSDRARFVRNF